MGSSATWSPRFMLAYGAKLMPPARVVCNALTLSGAGQSGVMSPTSFNVIVVQRFVIEVCIVEIARILQHLEAESLVGHWFLVSHGLEQ